ncbi:MAG: hypothetical protein ACK4SY_09325 [Pyrobaculum sp.]
MGCLSQLKKCGNPDLSKWLETCQGRCKDLKGKCRRRRHRYCSIQIDGCIEEVFEEFRDLKKADCLLLTDDCRLLIVEVKSTYYDVNEVIEQFQNVVKLLERLECHLDLVPVLYAKSHDSRQLIILRRNRVRYKGENLEVVTANWCSDVVEAVMMEQ